MSKNVLILSSSPRKGGNSDLLCDRFADGAREAGNYIEKINLFEQKIGYCLGCGACSERGRPCPQKDDAALIIQKMIKADVIVLATPVYFYTMSAQMKTLIDRACARYTEIRDKEFYFIVTAADTSREAMERTLEGFRGFTDCCLPNPKEMGVIYGTGAWKKGDIKKRPAMEEAYRMGKNV